MNLPQLRQDIDAIDQQLVTLLNKRAALAQQVGVAKGKGAKFSPAREAQVMRNITTANAGPFPDQTLVAIFREVISGSLALEQPLGVSYLGPTGTYSEEVARARFGAQARLQPCMTLDEALHAAEHKETDVVVLPIENSTEGAVNRTLDLLLQTPLQIIDEVMLPIRHQLLTAAPSLEAITEVAAHPQALAQCHAWLARHLPHAKQVAMNSNAEAAQAATELTGLAAIASTTAAQTYHLPILAANIEDDSANTTRFVVLGSVPGKASGSDKTALVCSVPNKPGELGQLIALFAKTGVNMTKLQSRPSPSGLWDYVFYIDLDGHVQDAPIAAALHDLRHQALFVKVLGSFPKAAL